MLFNDPRMDHLFRRTGFGASAEDVQLFGALGYQGAVDLLTDFEQFPDDIDSFIGSSGYAGVTASAGGAFRPNTVVNDARQRWLFRMVHSQRPLQEKMALFWHDHFATAYSKLAGLVADSSHAVRMMAAKPSEDPNGMRGQYELFRQYALGNFRDLVRAIAEQDAATNYWLDGYTNTRSQPQENFGRELMELFTRGVGYYTEEDVYAAARVYTGWNSRRVNTVSGDATSGRYEVYYNANQHQTAAKTFSFPIYADGSRTIPARGADAGIQDSLDLINALAGHRETALLLARKLWSFFVSEVYEPTDAWLHAIADTYQSSGYNMRSVVRRVLTSSQFLDPAVYFTRYAWPVEYVVRAIKEVGWSGFSLSSTLTPLLNMGQQLFEPPDVAGWDWGETWFSTGARLQRMNFASTLANNQRVNMATAARGNTTPTALVDYFLVRVTPMPYDAASRNQLVTYVQAANTFTGTDTQLRTKTAGLAHIMVASSEYQFV
ncbi:MAG: DUF1800 domain-containing protein [Acidobacteria bacterium]|nr:DUF1800 domain-containing protein [Acidobacteriota bacterium]